MERRSTRPSRVVKPQTRPASWLCLIHGGDEYSVKTRAREIYRAWCDELGGSDHEIIPAAANHAGEALKALTRLRMALDTLPFFGEGKAVWFQDCQFLGDERTASAEAVTKALAELIPVLRSFPWGKVRLLINAGKVDKRRAFYKALEKIAAVESFPELSFDSPDWMERLAAAARESLRQRHKQIDDDALSLLVTAVGPNLRQLQNEVEKLALSLGDRDRIAGDDIKAVVSRNKQARAFALGDALGERNLPLLLRALDDELWEMLVDRRKSEIGVLYGLIAKVRVMLLAKELLREGWLKHERDFYRFKSQLDRLRDRPLPLPDDKRFNPLAINPYVLYRASLHAAHYSSAELVKAMERLLHCNQQLVSSGLNEALLLQHALIQIARS
jgi:DNA polymerase III subunit delta